MTKYLRLLFATPALALAATAGIAAETKTFRADGVTYTYQTRDAGDGAKLLVGRSHTGGAFRLIVRDGKVSGQANGKPVRFAVADSRGAANGAVATAIAAD